MAKTQIGAVIGIEGASEYNRAISNIVRVTKEMESEIKLVESAFKNEYKTLQDVQRLEEKHRQLIDELKNKLKEQMDAQNAMNYERQRAIEKAEELRAKINLLSVEEGDHTKELEKTQEEYKANAKHIDDLNKGIINMATEINKTNTEINEHEKAIRNLPSAYKVAKEAIQKSTSEMGEMFVDIGKKFTAAFTVPYVAGVGASIKATKDWETAFIGVTKTNDEIVNSNNEVIYSYADLEKELQSIALRTGSSLSDIAKVAEISGQLGVATDQVAEFTEYVVQLSDSTNLSAEEGASYVATILNLMNHGMPIVATDAQRLGNAMVYLGNNFNTTEADIAAMAARLAPAAAQLNMTEGDVLGLATALSEAKITAEGGGTAMTQVLTNINKQMVAFRSDAESNLPRIAEIAGMTADEFANTWETRPIEALDAFITGLSQLDEEGEYTSTVLDELDMSGIRQSLSLNALALTHEHLTSAVAEANREFENGTALSDEAEKKYASLDSQLTQLSNALIIFGNSIGKLILPALKTLVEGLTRIVTALSNMPTPLKQFLLAFGGVLAVLGPALVIGGKILIGLAKLKGLATALGTTVAVITSTFATAIGVVLGVAAAIGALYVIIRNWDSVKEFIINVATAIWEGIKAVIGAIWEGITTIASNIWNVLSALLESILSGVLQLLEHLVARLILFALTTLPNLISNVVNKVKDMGSSIKNTITSLVSSALGWGKDLIGNLISGITSKIGSLINSVKNVASTIWSYLHFSEPEKGKLADFNTWMPDMMQGLAQGIYDNLYLVDRAAATVADSLGMGGNTSYNYGGVVINLNVPQGANGYQLVDEIENALTQRTVRRRAVFG